MTYVVIESKNLAGVRPRKAPSRALGGPLKLTIEHLGGQGHYQLGSVTNALGAVGGDVLPDGTTPGQRELMIAQISVVIHDWVAKLDKILAGKASLATVFFTTSPVHMSSTLESRALVQRARDSLLGTSQLDGLLPAVSRALRDYSRPVDEVQETFDAALRNMEASVQGSLQVIEMTRLSSIFKEAKAQAKKMVKDAAGEVPDALPWYVSAGIGLVGLAYVYNTFGKR